MHLKPGIDFTQFLVAINLCNSSVYFETTEGDSLNLSSVLSKYIFCSIADRPELYQEGSIRCHNPEDYKILADYLTE